MPLSGLLWSLCEGVSSMLYDIQLVMSAPYPPYFFFLTGLYLCCDRTENAGYKNLQCQVLSGIPRRSDCLLITLKNISSGFHLHIVHWAQAVYSLLLNACCQHFARHTRAHTNGAGAFCYQSESTCLHSNRILITSLGWQDVRICRSLWN